MGSSMKIAKVITACLLTFILGCTSTNENNREVASEISFITKLKESLKYFNSKSLDEVLKESATTDFKPTQAMLIRDNDSSLASKIYTIRKAKTSLKLIYYIYSNDETSSFVSQELINAARNGVDVYLLVDYIFNFPNLEHFQMLEERSALKNSTNGRVKVSFYNMPSLKLQAFAEYMVSGCPDETTRESDCAREKMAAINLKLKNSKGKKELQGITDNAKMFLAGFFSRNANLIKMSIGELDLSGATSGPSISDDDKAALLDFAKILFNLKVRKRYVTAGLKYLVAMALYGEKLAPVEATIESYIPASLLASRDLAYFTDYTHHKLLLADDSYMQIGGRNIENSYHLSKDDLVKKYLFRDTDMWFDISSDNKAKKSLSDSFRSLWLHPTSVRIDKIPLHSNTGLLKKIKDKSDPKRVLPLQKHIKNLDAFVSYKNTNLTGRDDLKNIYNNSKSSQRLRFSHSGVYNVDTNVAGASFYYLENFKEFSAGNPLYGSKNFEEKKFSKNIHKVWMKAMNNVCEKNMNLSKNPVIIHNAYYAPPANMLRVMGQQMNGKSNYRSCPNIHYKVVTNSLHTTDLSPVNLVGRRQMNKLHNYLRGNNKNKISFYEYTPLSVEAPNSKGKVQSLHTKALIINDDLYIGSANADVRSLMMDTNNGVYIRNHKPMADEYKSYLKNLSLESNNVINSGGKKFYALTDAQLLSNDRQIFNGMVRYFDLAHRLTESRTKSLEEFVFSILDTASSKSENLLKFNLDSEYGSDESKDFSNFNEYFKVF